jgi:diguanylate cyclase (GGDEF)-like protein
MPASLIILQHLARLTRVEDRDTLARAFVQALHAFTSPVGVWLFDVVVRDSGVITPLRARAGEAAALPPEFNRPEPRLTCVESAAPWSAEMPGLHLYRWPLVTDFDDRMVVELCTRQPLDDAAMQAVAHTGTVYLNLLRLLDHCERDSLTTLLNRKSFDESFLRITMQPDPVRPGGEAPNGESRHASERAEYWMAVMDIDHFKRVNDGFGHLIGDEVLLLMARIMRETFRHGDRLYRFGGEEFVVLLACQPGQCAHAIFERMRQNVENHVFPQVGHITISIGYTRIRPHDTPANAFDRADQAVYLAKSRGRNLALCYDEDLQTSTPEAQRKHGDLELF